MASDGIEIVGQLIYAADDGAALQALDAGVDGASVVWVGIVVDEHSNSNYVKLTGTRPDGTLLYEASVYPFERDKAAMVALAPSGTDLLVFMLAHNTSAPPRIEKCSVAKVEGVVTPGGKWGAGAGAYSGGGNPPAVEAGMTIQEYVDALTNPASQLSVQLDKHIKNNSQVGAERAVITGHVLTYDNVRPTLYQFTKDRVYEVFTDNVPGFWAWLLSKVTGGR